MKSQAFPAERYRPVGRPREMLGEPLASASFYHQTQLVAARTEACQELPCLVEARLACVAPRLVNQADPEKV